MAHHELRDLAQSQTTEQEVHEEGNQVDAFRWPDRVYIRLFFDRSWIEGGPCKKSLCNLPWDVHHRPAESISQGDLKSPRKVEATPSRCSDQEATPDQVRGPRCSYNSTFKASVQGWIVLNTEILSKFKFLTLLDFASVAGDFHKTYYYELNWTPTRWRTKTTTSNSNCRAHFRFRLRPPSSYPSIASWCNDSPTYQSSFFLNGSRLKVALWHGWSWISSEQHHPTRVPRWDDSIFTEKQFVSIWLRIYLVRRHLLI